MACERDIESVVVVRAGRNALSSAHVRSSAAAAKSALGLLSISVFGATNWDAARLLCETHPVLRGRACTTCPRQPSRNSGHSQSYSRTD